MPDLIEHAQDCIDRCRALALHSEEPGFITRTFLSPPMHAVHADLEAWMRQSGMTTAVDAVGNFRAAYTAQRAEAPVLFVGSHLDTVPRAGAFDGILGVVIGAKLLELLGGRQLTYNIEVIGFSEEEGVRFGFPFIGSRALIGDLDEAAMHRKDANGVSVAQAIRDFGLDPRAIGSAALRGDALGYLEFHIEQGPILESLGCGLGVVEAIAGQTRMGVSFEGRAGHAGTTPMHLRKDALACAAEWILAVEAEGQAVPGLVATVGHIAVKPGASNVIPGGAVLSIDVRHASDEIRHASVERVLAAAESIAARRQLAVFSELRMDQPAVRMDANLTGLLSRAARTAGQPVHVMTSGAGHDAMILARRMPATMLFLRSPGGISHHPEESVLREDVAAALAVGLEFLDELENQA